MELQKEQKESEKDFKIFVMYLQRTDRDFYKFCISNQLSLSKTSLTAKKNNWEKRTKEYDEYCNKTFMRNKEQALKELAYDTVKIQQDIKTLSGNVVHTGLERLFLELQLNKSFNLKASDLDKINNIFKS